MRFGSSFPFPSVVYVRGWEVWCYFERVEFAADAVGFAETGGFAQLHVSFVGFEGVRVRWVVSFGFGGSDVGEKVFGSCADFI